MADFKIDAQVRTVIGKKVRRLRKDGFVPITVYGTNTEAMSLQVPYRPLEIALRKAGGTNLINMNVDNDTHVVLARDVQRDVLRGTILHADFIVIDLNTKITADIPIVLVNESPAVVARKGILLSGTNNVTIDALPDKLMNEIQVDLSILMEVGDTISISDLDLGEGIDILNEPEEMIARVGQSSAARAEMLDAMDSEGEDETLSEGAEPEVISKGKEEEEDEE